MVTERPLYPPALAINWAMMGLSASSSAAAAGAVMPSHNVAVTTVHAHRFTASTRIDSEHHLVARPCPQVCIAIYCLIDLSLLVGFHQVDRLAFALRERADRLLVQNPQR